MDARVKLVVIDFNHNINREQNIVRKQRRGSCTGGASKWKIQMVKESKEWVAKEVKTPRSYALVTELLSEVIALKNTRISTNTNPLKFNGS